LSDTGRGSVVEATNGTAWGTSGGARERERERVARWRREGGRPPRPRIDGGGGGGGDDDDDDGGARASNQENPFATAPRGPGSIAPNVLA
jgi:hypothetical protein